MTDAEWRAATSPIQMVPRLPADTSDRKLRLYAAACCRHYWAEVPWDGADEVLDAAERYADGLAGYADLRATIARVAGPEVPPQDHPARPCVALGLEGAALAALTGSPSPPAVRADLLRCVMGHPFPRPAPKPRRGLGAAVVSALARWVSGSPQQPTADADTGPVGVVFEPEWRTEAVVALSRGIYDDRAFERLPVLADALEDAGCADPDILAHCRGGGPHARGCWVIDAALGAT